MPAVSPLFLCAMIAGGIVGGLVGQTINKRLNAGQVGRLFNVLLVVVTAISLYNAFRFAAQL